MFLEFPYTEFYMSDYLQLGFCVKEIYDNKNEVHGWNFQSSEGINVIMLNLYFISKRNIFFKTFLEWFWTCWFHEYMHMIGVKDNHIGFITQPNPQNNVIEIE